MSKYKVRALKAQFVTPGIVLESLAERTNDIEEIYVITKMKNPEDIRDYEFYASGDLNGLCMAAFVLNDYALKNVRGEILPEG